MIADESVDNGIIRHLRLLGFEILPIAEYSPGIDDKSVLQIAYDKDLVLITEDKDFGELVYRLKMKHKGVLLIRMNDLSREERLKIIPSIINSFCSKLGNNFSVLSSNGLRIKIIKRH